jgi:curved DNA-binding protein CbpA
MSLTHDKRLSASESPPAVGAHATGPPSQAVPAPDGTLRAALLELAEQLDRLSHFELLGLSEAAAAGEISAAFVRAAGRYHPDRLAGAGLSELVPQAERIVARMSEAAMILGDPARRAEYLAARAGKKAVGSTVPTVIEAETTFLKGEVFLRRGEHAKAIECFAAASKANPGEPQYRAYWAWARFEQPGGRKEAVVREVQRIIADAVAAQPRFTRGHFWLGQIWKFLNEPVRAERAFREAVNQDKDFFEAAREMRLLEMRRIRKGPTNKDPDPPRPGLMSRLFKK